VSQDASAQLRRVLALIPYFADDESHSLNEIARKANTDSETILADLYSLSERFGDPGGFIPGLQITIESATRSARVRANHFHRPMRLSAAELAALDLGLAMLKLDRTPGEQGAIDRARERLRKAMVRLPRDAGADGRRYAELGAHGDAAHLSALRSAMRARRKARIVYRSSEGREETARTICPYGLVASRGTWYVIAHCDERKSVRIFRLDRMESVKDTTSSFEIPESFSLDSIVAKDRVFRAPPSEPLRVRYSPRVARWIAEREGVPLAADGSLTLEHPLADVHWAVRHVLQYGADAVVLAPESVRDEVRKRLRAVLGKGMER
jgi:predicted DNA-binding transcriptional regulator YafY